MAAHRTYALGAADTERALLSTSPLRHSADTEFFADRAYVLARNNAIAQLIGGVSIGGLPNLQLPVIPGINPLAGVIPQVPRPFMFLRIDWQGDGSDVSYYSEMDLANGRHQMLGKILQVGDFSRAYGANRNLQRMSNVSLVLEDLDRSVATRVRKQVVSSESNPTNQYNFTRFYFSVGADMLTEDYYSAITCPFRVQRADITETTVEFDLMDASDDVLVAQIVPPTISALSAGANGAGLDQGTRMKISGTNDTANYDWFVKRPFKDGLPSDETLIGTQGYNNGQAIKISLQKTPSNVIPVPFNAFTKSPYTWARNDIDAHGDFESPRNNPLGVIVLGASKKADWMQPHFWGDCQKGPAQNVRPEPIIYVEATDGELLSPLLAFEPGVQNAWQPDGHNGSLVYIDVNQVFQDSPMIADGEIWYVAIMYILVDSAAGTGAQTFIDNNFNKRHALTRLALAASRDKVFIDWNGLAASTTWGTNEEPVPAQVLGYLAQYHAFTPLPNIAERGPGAIRGEGRILDNYDDSLTSDGLTGTPVGGAILQTMAGSDVANEICATTLMDQAYSTEGRLALRPSGVTANDKVFGIKGARELNDNDHILAGTWREHAPKGDDRWGWGNLYGYNGAQETAKVLGWDGTPPANVHTKPPAGQNVLRNIDITWRRQFPFDLQGDAPIHATWTAPYSEERETVDFDVHFAAAVGLDLGNYVYVTHYAGSNGDGSKGWNRKLCRVDGLDIRWEARTVGVTAIVMEEHQDKLLLISDFDEWTQQKPFGRAGTWDTMQVTSGSPTVNVHTAAGGIGLVTSSAWIGSLFKIAPGFTPVPYPDAGYTIFATSLSFTSKITGVGAGTITLADNAPFSGTFYAWRILYSHVNPPPKAVFAGDLATVPDDAAPWTKYAQMADDAGLFSNGDPAQGMPV